MQPGTIKVQKGDDATLTLVLTNEGGSAFNTSGETLTFTFQRRAQYPCKPKRKTVASMLQ